MNKRLRNSVELASKKLEEVQYAFNEIGKNLTYCGFGKEEPILLLRDNSIYLSWNHLEMSIEEAVERMEEYGYINIGDFDR